MGKIRVDESKESKILAEKTLYGWCSTGQNLRPRNAKITFPIRKNLKKTSNFSLLLLILWKDAGSLVEKGRLGCSVGTYLSFFLEINEFGTETFFKIPKFGNSKEIPNFWWKLNHFWDIFFSKFRKLEKWKFSEFFVKYPNFGI